jgi:predicted amidohydrolase YtcJ
LDDFAGGVASHHDVEKITARDTDDALEANGVAGTPVVLFDWTGHSLSANSVALDLAGISEHP